MAEVLAKDLTSYIDFLPIQFSNSPNVKAFLSIFLAQAQELENANMELDRVSTSIDLATGYQLDIIGKLIGVNRLGRDDVQYRKVIIFQISVNVGNGTPEDVIQYLSYVTNASKVGYWEHYPAMVILETNGTTIPSNIANMLGNLTIAGVSVGGVIVSETGKVFRGCSLNEAYSNSTDPANTPISSSGEALMACGEELAYCAPEFSPSFTPVEDTSLLSRCILPSIGDLRTDHVSSSGEALMACGEELAYCAPEFSNTSGGKGTFAVVYTKT